MPIKFRLKVDWIHTHLLAQNVFDASEKSVFRLTGIQVQRMMAIQNMQHVGKVVLPFFFSLATSGQHNSRQSEKRRRIHLMRIENLHEAMSAE